MKFSYPSGAKPLAGYTIKRGIGIGGFGEVYFAISDAGKEVALKKIQRNMDIELRGVRHCLNLKHINLISLWDIQSTASGESWVVMEYVPGKSLQDVVEENPRGMPEQEIKNWFSATAAGVEHLHKHGIVHRDLKPANIFRDDDQQVVKIGDYGLSKFISCGRRSGNTESVGTFHYMAPEIGKGVYGKEIDIYALGVIFYEMLTGDVPFDGESSQEIIMKHLTADVRLEKVPPAFHRVIQRALKKDPHARFGSVSEMLQELPWSDFGTGQYFAASNTNQTSTNLGSTSAESQNGGAVIEPLFVSGDNMRVVRPDIVFGPLNDSSSDMDVSHRNAVEKITANHPGSHAADHSAANDDPIQIIRATGAVPPPIAQQPVPQMPIANSAAYSAQAMTTPERDGRWNQFRWWWTDSAGATVGKLLLLVVGSAAALSSAFALVTIGALIGVCFLAWFMVRHKIVPLQLSLEDPVNLKATHPGKDRLVEYDHPSLDKQSRYLATAFGVNAKQLGLTRRWLMERSWRDRSIEFLGSLLVASLSCIALNLLAMAVCPHVENATSDWVWSWFAWLTSVSIFSCMTLLLLGKFWEHRPSSVAERRIIMLVASLAIGIAGWTLADFFDVELGSDLFVSATPAWASWFPSTQLKNVPSVMAWLVALMGLFGVLRWWHQADPARKTRLSLRGACLCFVWALVFSYILGQPVTKYCVMATVVSISIQLAAPRIGFEDRKNIYSSGN